MSVGQEASSTTFETLPAFYPPNDPDRNNQKEDFDLTHREFEQIKDALKQEQFRKLLVEYVEDVQVSFGFGICRQKVVIVLTMIVICNETIPISGP